MNSVIEYKGVVIFFLLIGVCIFAMNYQARNYDGQIQTSELSYYR